MHERPDARRPRRRVEAVRSGTLAARAERHPGRGEVARRDVRADQVNGIGRAACMEPTDPKKLDSAPLDNADAGDDGVRRYYREPPPLEQLIAIAGAVVAVLVLLAVIGFFWLRSRL